MNTACAWDRNSLSEADTVNGVARLIGKDMVKESISQMKNGKTVRPSIVVSEMVKAVGEAEDDMITGLVNQIIRSYYGNVALL